MVITEGTPHYGNVFSSVPPAPLLITLSFRLSPSVEVLSGLHAGFLDCSNFLTFSLSFSGETEHIQGGTVVDFSPIFKLLSLSMTILGHFFKCSNPTRKVILFYFLLPSVSVSYGACGF